MSGCLWGDMFRELLTLPSLLLCLDLFLLLASEGFSFA